MANAWFRLYSEFVHDPKIQMMSEAMQRRFVMLLCDRCSDVLVTLSDDEMAYRWHISPAELAETKALFIAKGFIEDDWSVVNWNKRQFVSDSSTERTRRYRERKRTSQVTVGDGCDMPDTDTDTEQIQNREESNPAKTVNGNPPPIGPEMVASAVLETLSLSGKWLRGILTDVARAEMKKGQQPEVLRDAMCDAWTAYQLARSKGELSFTPGADKFFGEGMWNNKAGWPWKEEYEPEERSDSETVETNGFCPTSEAQKRDVEKLRRILRGV